MDDLFTAKPPQTLRVSRSAYAFFRFLILDALYDDEPATFIFFLNFFVLYFTVVLFTLFSLRSRPPGRGPLGGGSLDFPAMVSQLHGCRIGRHGQRMEGVFWSFLSKWNGYIPGARVHDGPGRWPNRSSSLVIAAVPV